jgi:integrase
MARRATSTLHLLTVREVQAAREGDHSDGGGLLLRVRGDGASWVYRFTSPAGRRREMGLGKAYLGSAKQAGDSLTGARHVAHAAREQLRRGVDPIDAREADAAAAKAVERAKKDEQARERWTLARAARDYHERVIEPAKTVKHAAQWIASLENHVPSETWHKPISEVAAPELLAALSKVRALDDRAAKVPETLQRIRQRLDAVFEDAIFHGRCTSNAAAAIKRKMREAMPRKEAGEFKALPYREAPAFMATVRSAEGIAARSLEFAALTAARTAEVLGATWREFDVDGALWVIPKERMKAKEPHTVHLSSRALELLAGQRGLDKRYVFPSPMLDGKPLSNMAMLVLLGRLGMRDRTTVHGLCRATFSTWANETAAARPDVIEACLAHREADRVRKAYNRAQFNQERRALLEAWSEFLMRPLAANVVPLRAA